MTLPYKPLWELLHDGWIDDFREAREQLTWLKSMRVKHLHDPMGVIFLSMVKDLEGWFKKHRAVYKREYGYYPKI